MNEYLWQELELSEFFACEPAVLNDPFDCQLDPFPSLHRAIYDCKDQNRISSILKILGSFEKNNPLDKSTAIVCFSGSMESTLMWSHYAASHTGVCLMYDVPRDYFNGRYNSKEDGPIQVGLADVEYGDQPFYNWLLSGDLDDPLDGELIVNAAAKALISKASTWAYEEEVRLIMSESCFVKFKPTFLKQVTFGLKTPKRMRSLVRSLVSRRSPDAKFSECQRSEKAEFELRFQDLG